MKNQNKQTREVKASKLREFLNELAGDLCAGLDTVRVDLTGNTFEIHLEGATIDITVNESRKGGEQ